MKCPSLSLVEWSLLFSMIFSSFKPPNLDKTTLWKIIIDILTEPSPRQKLDHFNTLDDVVELLKGSKNIVVLTGAGVCSFSLCKSTLLVLVLYIFFNSYTCVQQQYSVNNCI